MLLGRSEYVLSVVLQKNRLLLHNEDQSSTEAWMWVFAPPKSILSHQSSQFKSMQIKQCCPATKLNLYHYHQSASKTQNYKSIIIISSQHSNTKSMVSASIWIKKSSIKISLECIFLNILASWFHYYFFFFEHQMNAIGNTTLCLDTLQLRFLDIWLLDEFRMTCWFLNCMEDSKSCWSDVSSVFMLICVFYYSEKDHA